MHTDEFDYDLPQSLIAQEPLQPRDSCRLMYLHRSSGRIEHRTFRSLIEVLKPGDHLVFNNTKVIPARVLCRKATGAAVELFFLERIDSLLWTALVKPARRLPPGTIVWPEGFTEIELKIEEVCEDGYERKVRLVKGGESLDQVIEKYGHIPLPHYIQRDDSELDHDLYQTVYASTPGAVAAPTAGLHFTAEMLEELAGRGIKSSFVTLHVGIGTFRPVQVEDPRLHDMHEERYELNKETADAINATWESGGRVIAVGTTVVRVLETCAESFHKVLPSTGRTKIMILPPYEFKAIDGIITNFHLPKSTLLMLVSAFSSREAILNAYREAVEKKYRFYSYGDAMLLL